MIEDCEILGNENVALAHVHFIRKISKYFQLRGSVEEKGDVVD